MLLNEFPPDSPYWVTWVGRGLLQNKTKGTCEKKIEKDQRVIARGSRFHDESRTKALVFLRLKMRMGWDRSKIEPKIRIVTF
jgi:hypothetical protein